MYLHQDFKLFIQLKIKNSSTWKCTCIKILNYLFKAICVVLHRFKKMNLKNYIFFLLGLLILFNVILTWPRKRGEEDNCNRISTQELSFQAHQSLRSSMNIAVVDDASIDGDPRTTSSDSLFQFLHLHTG